MLGSEAKRRHRSEAVSRSFTASQRVRRLLRHVIERRGGRFGRELYTYRMQEGVPEFTQPTVEMLEIEPRTVTFPGGEEIQCIEFSGDGESLYAATFAEMLDLRVIVGEETGWVALGLIVPMLLVMVVCIWRVRIRPQRSGGVYCRRCNFEVGPSRQAGIERCSECGTGFAKKPPVRGRSRWVRWAPAGVVGVLVMTLAFSVYSPWTKKTVSDWAAKRVGASGWWFEVLRDAGVPMKVKWVCTGSRLIEVDATTGEQKRAILIRRGRIAELRLMPDGNTLLVNHWNRMEAVNVENGRRVAVFQPFDDAVITLWNKSGSGFFDDGNSVLLNWWRSSKEDVYLTAWNPATGDQREMLSVRTIMGDGPRVSGTTVQYNKGAFLLPIGDVRSASGFDVLRVDWEKGWNKVCEVINTGTRSVRVYGIETSGEAIVPVFLRADGTLGYIVDIWDTGIFAFNPRTGERDGALDVTELQSMEVRDLKLAHEDRWLFASVRQIAPVFMTPVFVRDMKQNEWIAQLKCLPGDGNIDVVVNASASRAAAMSVRTARTWKRYGAKGARTSIGLTIWDLSPLLQAEAERDAAESLNSPEP